MKKIIQFSMAFAVLMVFPVLAFSQEVGSAVVSGFDPSVFFVSLGALVGAVMTVTQFLKKQLPVSGFTTKFLSWIIALLLSGIGWYFQWGIFVGAEWYWIFAYALAAGLVGNSIFDIHIIKGIIKIFRE